MVPDFSAIAPMPTIATTRVVATSVERPFRSDSSSGTLIKLIHGGTRRYYRAAPFSLTSLTLKLQYGTRTSKWAKTEVTTQFLVENYP